jgi:hypothetical protein
MPGAAGDGHEEHPGVTARADAQVWSVAIHSVTMHAKLQMQSMQQIHTYGLTD